jgi:hypothetical protein
MTKAQIAGMLENHLFSLEKFSAGDTRRVGGDGTIFSWYTAKRGEGRIRKFRTLKEVEQWGLLLGFDRERWARY